MQVASGSGRSARKRGGSLYDGGEIGSTGCSKGTKRLSKLVNANDNNASRYALAA